MINLNKNKKIITIRKIKSYLEKKNIKLNYKQIRYILKQKLNFSYKKIYVDEIDYDDLSF